MAATRPLISPEPFSGECSWTDWVDHFEAAAAVNGWDNPTKLKWLPVHLHKLLGDACQLMQKETTTLLKRLCASVLNQTARDSGMYTWCTDDVKTLSDITFYKSLHRKGADPIYSAVTQWSTWLAFGRSKNAKPPSRTILLAWTYC